MYGAQEYEASVRIGGENKGKYMKDGDEYTNTT